MSQVTDYPEVLFQESVMESMLTQNKSTCIVVLLNCLLMPPV